MVVEITNMTANIRGFNLVNQVLPLCVDLNGTLVKTDLLFESVVLLLRQRCWYLFILLFWMIRGSAYFKARVAEVVSLKGHPVPYSETFIDWLWSEKKKGRQLILVTGADQAVAQTIADKLGLFDEVFGSDGVRNLNSKRKAAFLCEYFGAEQFDYAGNAATDWPVWEVARASIVVNPTRWVKRRLQGVHNLSLVFEEKSVSRWRVILKAMRTHQYFKNILILVPLFVSHSFMQMHLVGTNLIGILAFCLLASAVYLINDLFDLDSDRRHQSKCRRPIASGALGIPGVMGLVTALIFVVIGLTFMLPVMAGTLLVVYFALAITYSLLLKRLLLVDVLTLASLYTMRIVYGAALSNVPLTAWLLIFSMFSFLSLAFLKRYIELLLLPADQNKQLPGRAYKKEHTRKIKIAGLTSGYSAAIVFVMYLYSEHARQLYQQPQILWLILPLIIYWISRVWLLASKQQLNEDPIVFAITDLPSYIIVLLVFVIGVIAYF